MGTQQADKLKAAEKSHNQAVDELQLKYDELNCLYGETEELLGDNQHKINTDEGWLLKALELVRLNKTELDFYKKVDQYQSTLRNE